MTDRMTVDELRAYERDRWTEQEFTDEVIRLFQENGWLVHHDRPARTRDGWRTAVQGDKGFPDIVAAKDGRVVFAELKRKGGKVRPEQVRWLNALPHHADIDDFTDRALTFLWYPDNWDAIEEVARS